VPGLLLFDICHARSGDKGRDANVGLIAWHPDLFETLLSLTSESAMKEHFGPLVVGPIDRYVLPNISAVNLVLHDALDGGGTRSLRIDAQGKALCEITLRMKIEVTEEVEQLVRTHNPREA